MRGARTAPAKQGYHHGDLRRVLLDAALRRFAERGDAELTLRELARDVGVSHNAPYRHFASKAELYASLRDDGFARLADRERQALAGAGSDARARVKALGEAYVRFALEDAPSFRLALSHPPARDPAHPDAATASFGLLEQTIEEARKQGAVRTDLSAKELALAAWSLVHGLATLVSSGQLPGRAAQLSRYTELLATVFFDGASARVSERGRAAARARASRSTSGRGSRGRP